MLFQKQITDISIADLICWWGQSAPGCNSNSSIFPSLSFPALSRVANVFLFGSLSFPQLLLPPASAIHLSNWLSPPRAHTPVAVPACVYYTPAHKNALRERPNRRWIYFFHNDYFQRNGSERRQLASRFNWPQSDGHRRRQCRVIISFISHWKLKACLAGAQRRQSGSALQRKLSENDERGRASKGAIN